MGTYVYRVTKERVICSDGKEANVAVFAYKPTFSWDSDKYNSKWHFQSGSTASDRMARNGKLTDRVVFPGNPGVYLNTKNEGSFYDGDIGTDRHFPKVEGVTNSVAAR
jgi:hypothetical protein